MHLCKLVQPLMEIRMKVPQKFNVKLPYNPNIPLLMYAGKNQSYHKL